MYTLAKKIANFIWDLDPYDLPYDNIGELIAKTLQDLADKTKRETIIQWLTDCETDTDYASELAKEVATI